jgi:hypothetical protein
MNSPEPNVGDTIEVVLELIKDPGKSRPRMRPIEGFTSTARVEISRKLREMFPLGTLFRAKVTVCQKHYEETGKPKGPIYLRSGRPFGANGEISVMIDTIKNPGIIAQLDLASTDEQSRKYFYIDTLPQAELAANL